jgi:hypothetical protein
VARPEPFEQTPDVENVRSLLLSSFRACSVFNSNIISTEGVTTFESSTLDDDI